MSKILYKFLAIENEEQIQRVFNMLEFGEVYFSSPANFNDPFDSRPFVLGLETGLDQVVHLMKIGREYGKDSDSVLKRHKELVSEKGIRFVEKLMNLSAHKAIDKQGVLCLAGDRKHPLMWSHYACSHRGVCIGLRTEGSVLTLAERVRYEDHRGRYHIDSSDMRHVYEQAFSYKAPFWDYEDEHRLVAFSYTPELRERQARGMPPHIADFIRSRNGPGTYRLGVSQVDSIAFGVNVDPTNKRCIARFARDKVPGIDVSQAVKVPDKYALTFSKRLV